MSMPWSEFLVQLQARYSSPLDFAYQWWLYNAPVIDRVRATVPPGGRLLEIGPGTGAISTLLAASGYHVTGIDLDPEVVQGASRFAEYFRTSCHFEVGDGFDLSGYADQFDLAFSCGVIEHFERVDAVRMLVQQGIAAKQVLTVVPTTYALRNDPLAEASNARPMTLRLLREIFCEADLDVTQSFGYGMPDDGFSKIFHYCLPRVAQWVLIKKLSYACSVGCFGRSKVCRQ